MNAAVTFRWIEDVDARPEGDASIITPGTFGAAGNILGTIIDCVFIEWVGRWRRNGTLVVGPAAERLMVGTGRWTARGEICPRRAVVIGKSGVARTGRELQSKDAPGVVIDIANGIEARLDWSCCVFPESGRWIRRIIEAHS